VEIRDDMQRTSHIAPVTESDAILVSRKAVQGKIGGAEVVYEQGTFQMRGENVGL
jgi:hypothetical protein